MRELRYHRYPWETLLRNPGDCDPNGRTWSSGGVLRLPPGAQVSFALGRGRLHRIAMTDSLVAMPKRREPVRMRVVDAFSDLDRTIELEAPASLAEVSPRRTFRDLPLYETVLAWSSFFDECLVDERGGELAEPLSWEAVAERLETLLANPDEPQMSLIVRIADALTTTLEAFERGIRRVLTRDRRMMPADKAEEFDAASVDWYVRQPGRTAAEKAAFNQQRLKAVARREFVDTLENRVLKDFLKRSAAEARRWCGALATPGQLASARALRVRRFERLCMRLLALPAFEEILPVTGVVQPNYVLQGDARYRKIWRFYQLLLRRQRAADTLWAWQSRLWSDVAQAAVNVVLARMAEKSRRGDSPWRIEPLADSAPSISFEQSDGRRLEGETSSGPFIIRRRGAGMADGCVLELVESERLPECLSASPDRREDRLGDVCGAVAALLTPLSAGARMRRTAILFWPLHSLADGILDQPSVLRTMEAALDGLEGSGFDVRGVALSSDLLGMPAVSLERSVVLQLGARPADWAKTFPVLEEQINAMLGAIFR